nr:PIN domain-containing protein [Duganella rivi]
MDTNVLLRYFMQDDAQQYAQAASLINTLSRTEQGFVSLVVVAELVWVLSYSFQLRRVELHAVLTRLVNMPELKVEKAAHVYRRYAGLNYRQRIWQTV